MKLYDLGIIPWKDSQLVYHALARRNEQALVICTPKEDYACVGFHQDIAFELDLNYCLDHDIGVFRREIGGGTVFLDKNQLFYQMIIDRKNAPLDQRALFRKYLEPVIRTYKALGIGAEYNPVSDLVVNGRKISGNGGGDIGNCKVMTGSILLDFDCETMCNLLKLPSERFRDRVCSAMKEKITSVKDELGSIPNIKDIISLLVGNWEDLFGNLTIASLSEETKDMMQSLDTMFSSDEWLYKRRKRKSGRNIKIIEGINLIHDIYSGVEMCIEIRNEKIWDIEVFGDFAEGGRSILKRRLEGRLYSAELISEAVNSISDENAQN